MWTGTCFITACCTSNVRSEPFSESRRLVAVPAVATVMACTPQKSVGISNKKQQKDFWKVSMASLAAAVTPQPKKPEQTSEVVHPGAAWTQTQRDTPISR